MFVTIEAKAGLGLCSVYPKFTVSIRVLLANLLGLEEL